MKKNGPSKLENVTSALCGGTSLFVLIFIFTRLGEGSPHTTLLALAFSMEGFALALAPAILFERMTFKELRAGREPARFGIAAIFSGIAKICLVLCAVFFAASKFLG